MKSLEQRLLAQADLQLDRAAATALPDDCRTSARLTILEVASAILGQWDLDEYWDFAGHHPVSLRTDPKPLAAEILREIANTPIPASLALSALSREILPKDQQRKTGAYYTDWRLAQMLAETSVPRVTVDGLWVDAACGSGVLLTAAGLQVPAGPERDAVIADRLTGADLSKNALRGTLLSVASLTSDLSAVREFSSRLLLQDSLRSKSIWKALAPSGAALVIGNPPWEKLKLSRHELAKRNGVRRTYGQRYEVEIDVESDRSKLLSYIDQVASGTRLQGRGEHDLYKLFLELGMGIAADDGILALLLPAGLIRAQGTEGLRRELTSASNELSISVIENRARHFAIDTRFKFLSVVATIGTGRRQPISLRVADRAGALPAVPVPLGRAKLAEIRPDLSIPEVRSQEEWDLYARLASNSSTVGDPSGNWKPVYWRELDMTLDRSSFRAAASDNTVPLIEGRHVGQFRWRAKTYQSGEGRSAIWRPEDLSSATLKAQWHVPIDVMRKSTAQRTTISRIGFCDITGQTNERSFIAARIPAGVVCGNKVPTLEFKDGGEDREDLFLSLANSFIVDWMLRRTVTTTVNFFLLDTLPLPLITENSCVGQELVCLTRKLTSAEGDPEVDPWSVAKWRARSDALVAASWGLGIQDMTTVLRDFPLLDRGQPALPGESKSTVTADLVLSELAELSDIFHESSVRSESHREAGAIPYVPAEYRPRGR